MEEETTHIASALSGPELVAPLVQRRLRPGSSRLVVVILALVIELADEREAGVINQASIDVDAKRVRVASCEGVLPLADLPRSREEQLPARPYGARQPGDGRVLRVWCEQEHQPPCDDAVEQTPEVCHRLDRLTTHGDVGDVDLELLDHAWRRVDGMHTAAGIDDRLRDRDADAARHVEDLGPWPE